MENGEGEWRTEDQGWNGESLFARSPAALAFFETERMLSEW